MVKPVVEGLKRPSGVKRSSAITSPLPKNAAGEKHLTKKNYKRKKQPEAYSPRSWEGKKQ